MNVSRNAADIIEVAQHLTTCKSCGGELRYYKQFSRFFGECTDATCKRVHITLELNDLAALTDAQVDEFLADKAS